MLIIESGVDYDDVLKEAQELGFAEADPTADVEGHDVRAKIALLAKLSLGVYVEPEQVPTTGISSVSSFDFKYSHYLGSTIKMLGMARVTENDEIAIMVPLL